MFCAGDRAYKPVLPKNYDVYWARSYLELLSLGIYSGLHGLCPRRLQRRLQLLGPRHSLGARAREKNPGVHDYLSFCTTARKLSTLWYLAPGTAQKRSLAGLAVTFDHNYNVL